MTEATAGPAPETASQPSSPRTIIGNDPDSPYPLLDRDRPKQSIESETSGPLEKKSFDLADPGLFFLPWIPRGKPCTYPWFRREPASPSPQASENAATADRESDTVSSSLISCGECGKACRDAKALR